MKQYQQIEWMGLAKGGHWEVLIHVINWAEPEKNDFAIAEEVTLRGGLERRPDLVLYVNGIAIGVIELKNSHVSVGDGIRQLLSNQKKEFNEWFFTTVQIVFAGNDSEGMRYGTIGTGEKYFLRWKEDEADNSRLKLPPKWRSHRHMLNSLPAPIQMA